jgi:cytidylate kinase
MTMNIAISGRSGCGNTTVSSLVAAKLGLRLVNFTFRNLAAERGLSLEDALRLAAADDGWDREIDTRQLALARNGGGVRTSAGGSCAGSDGGCVLGSRLAIWMLEEAGLKVYLRAASEPRVARILQREGGEAAAVAAFTAERDRQDHARYLRIYGIDTDDYAFAGLIIDTDTLESEEVAARIIAAAGSIHDAGTIHSAGALHGR